MKKDIKINELAKRQADQFGSNYKAFYGLLNYEIEKKEKKERLWKRITAILATIAFLMSIVSLLFALYVRSAYSIDEATFQKQLEQKICKIKKNTPVMIKHWDGTELQVIFVENPKDQPDVILVRVWGKVLPMEKVLIKEIKKR